jgi:hypothetical protein
MSVILTKIIDGRLAVADILSHERTKDCPRCYQTYRLGYSGNEWSIKDWLKLAQAAIRKDHDSRREVMTVPIEWQGIRGQRYP